jgi:hypothetical protein
MRELVREDLVWAVRRLPRFLADTLKARGPKLVIAGGYLRSVIGREDVNDVDLFSPTKDAAKDAAHAIANHELAMFTAGHKWQPCSTIETDNAITVLTRPYSSQFIHRWTFEKPEDIVPTFDFTIARAALWFDGEWKSLCDERFYSDLAAKRLVYCLPVREEEAGGSMLRILKFYQRGYRIPLDSLGAVMARLMKAVDHGAVIGACGDNRAPAEIERQTAKIITGLLREVDPSIDPDHIAHLPAQEHP